VILLLNPKFHFNNFCFVVKILLENDYPLEFIFDNNINKRLKNINNLKKKKQDSDNIESIRPWFTVPYVPMFSEKFNRLNSENIRISLYSVNKLRKFIKVHKDLDPFRMKRNLMWCTRSVAKIAMRVT